MHEERRQPISANRIDRNLPPRYGQGVEGVSAFEVNRWVLQHERRRVASQEANEAVLRAESQRSDTRVNPVGSDYQIRAHAGAVRECGIHAIAVLFERADGGSVANVDRPAHLGKQHALQFAAHEVEMVIVEKLAKFGIRDGELLMPSPVEKRQLGDGVVDALEIAEQSKPLGGVVARAEEVDHVAAAARPRRLLDDSAPDSGAVET